MNRCVSPPLRSRKRAVERSNVRKCDACREKKVKCQPPERFWPGQKCEHCARTNLGCGPNLNQKDSEYINARRLARRATGPAQTEVNVVGDTISVGEPLAISGDVVDLGRAPMLHNGTEIPSSPLPSGWLQPVNLILSSAATPQPSAASGSLYQANIHSSTSSSLPAPWVNEEFGGSLSPGRAMEPGTFGGLSSCGTRPYRQYNDCYTSAAGGAGQRKDDIPSKILYLAYMNILDEEIENSKQAITPQAHNDIAKGLECNSKFMRSTATREFEITLQAIVDHLHESNSLFPNSESTLRYREVLDLIQIFEARHAEGNLFLDSKIHILRKLADTYQAQNNLPLAEHYLKQLVALGCERDNANVTENIDQLTDCFIGISQGLLAVTKTMKLHLPNPPNVDGTIPFPPLQRAIRTGLDDVTRALCERGCRMQDVDVLQQNAVHAAATVGKLPLLERFLQIDRKLCTGRDLLKRTPLFYAAHWGDLASVVSLVKAGAAVNDRDEDGENILGVAAAAGHLPVVRFLLDHNVNPNDNPLGKPSPLHRAARGGHKNVCHLLLTRGARADPVLPPYSTYQTPADFANDAGFPDLGHMLGQAQWRSVDQLGLPEDCQEPVNTTPSSSRGDYVSSRSWALTSLPHTGHTCDQPGSPSDTNDF